jgi:hypothetical protein
MKGLKPMDRRAAVTLYVVAMVAVIVGVDLVLQKQVLGTAYSEYWYCLSLRSFLLQISASMIAMYGARGVDRLCEAGETETQTAPLPMISPVNVYRCATDGSVVAQRAKTAPRGHKTPRFRW